MKPQKSSDAVQISLDNASSVGLTLRGKRKPIMAEYLVKWKGAEIRCKSVEDAARLLERLDASSTSLELRSWNAAEFSEFVDRLEVMPRQLLAFLVERVSATDAELREHLGLKGNKQLAGVLSGISKVAMLLDIEPRRVYTQHTTYKSGKPERRYYASPAFKKAAEDVDWPSEKDLEEESLIPLE